MQEDMKSVYWYCFSLALVGSTHNLVKEGAPCHKNMGFITTKPTLPLPYHLMFCIWGRTIIKRKSLKRPYFKHYLVYARQCENIWVHLNGRNGSKIGSIHFSKIAWNILANNESLTGQLPDYALLLRSEWTVHVEFDNGGISWHPKYEMTYEINMMWYV